MPLDIIITPELVIDTWGYMFHEYGITPTSKSSSPFMTLIRPFTGIDRKHWARFSTLIGHTLYTDIELGVETPKLSLLGQLLIIPHECQHKIQDDNEVFYPVKYLCSKWYRVKTEIDGYTCNQELFYLLTGRIIPIERFVERLTNYQLDDKHLKFAESRLLVRTARIESGEYLMKPAKMAAVYLACAADRPRARQIQKVDYERLLL